MLTIFSHIIRFRSIHNKIFKRRFLNYVSYQCDNVYPEREVSHIMLLKKDLSIHYFCLDKLLQRQINCHLFYWTTLTSSSSRNFRFLFNKIKNWLILRSFFVNNFQPNNLLFIQINLKKRIAVLIYNFF